MSLLSRLRFNLFYFGKALGIQASLHLNFLNSFKLIPQAEPLILAAVRAPMSSRWRKQAGRLLVLILQHAPFKWQNKK